MSNIAKLLMLMGIGLLLAAGSIWLIGGKKKEYRVTTTVQAAPIEVFPYLAEIDKKKKWLKSLVGEELIPSRSDIESEREPAFDVGTGILTTLIIDNQPVQLPGKIIRFNPGEILSIRSGNDDIVLTHVFRLKQKRDATEIEFRKVIRHNGYKRFTVVFDEDTEQDLIEQEMGQLVNLLKSEIGLDEVKQESLDEGNE